MRTPRNAFVLTLTLALASCSDPDGLERLRAEGPAPSLDAGRALAAANNAFAVDLYGTVRGSGGNLLLSPYSIMAALAMAHEGAGGATRDELAGALHLGEGSTVGGFRDLDLLLEPGMVEDWASGSARQVPAFELAIANRLWVDDELDVEQAFVERLAGVFAASPEEVDFGRPERARRRINEWALNATRQRIRDIVPEGQPPADTLMALASAIYFKARWAETFHEGATTDAPFRREEGPPVQVRMMRQQSPFAYAETDEAQLLELSYEGRQVSMVVVLPKTDLGLADLERDLDAGRLALELESLARRPVIVALPRFEFESAFALEDALRALGVRSAFTPEAADFSGIAPGTRLPIASVVHKAFIHVDEEGTEAAAVTFVVAGAEVASDEPVSFVADHPFLFLIRHRPTGCILFLGRVVDPGR